MFNYRLSRARRIIENAFGILAARYCTSATSYISTHAHSFMYRWRLFRRPIISQPGRVVIYTKAAIALHNYLRTTESAVYCPPGFIDGEDGIGNVMEGAWRTDDEQSTGMEPVARTSSNRYIIIVSIKYTITFSPPAVYRHSRSAASIRDSYRDYFISKEGEVSWQYTHVRRTQ